MTTAFASSDINHSDNVMQTVQKLGDIVRIYGRDNHISRNMGKVIDYAERLGSAERAARALFHCLKDLPVPTEGGHTASPSRKPWHPRTFLFVFHPGVSL